MSSRISFIALTSRDHLRELLQRRRASGPRRTRRRTAARRPCPGPAARSPGVAFSGFTHTTRWATRCEARHLLGRARRGRRGPSRRRGSPRPRRAPCPARPTVVERAQALAEAGAARPVDDRVARPRRSAASGSRDDELAGDPGEPGAERERLDPAAADDRGVEEAQRGPGRTAPSTRSRRSSSTSRRGPRRRLRRTRAASARRRRAARAARCGAGRGGPRRRATGARRRERPQRAGEPQVGHQPAGLVELGGGVGGEVACARSTSAGL